MPARASSQRLFSLSVQFLCCLIAMNMLVPAASVLPAATVNAASVSPSIQLTKTVLEPASGSAQVGEQVVFQITLTNTGATTITVLPLADTFDPRTLQFTGATISSTPIAPSLQSTGVISWTDLTLLPSVGDLAAGASVMLRTTFKALAVTQPGVGLSPTTPSNLPPVAPQASVTGQPTNPNDYYDLETRFLIDKAIDPVNGGVYLAVKSDGTPWGAIPDAVYGFPGGFLQGTAKHPGGQGICVEYFVNEYQRLTDTGRSITTQNHGVLRAHDMLTWAKNCADFVDAHMIIGGGQNEPKPPACTPGVGNTCLYYWGFVDADGMGGQLPSSGQGVNGYIAPDALYITDSFVAWNIAELALKLQAVGDSTYANYKQQAYAFWNWMHVVGPPFTPDPALPNQPPTYSGRDRFLPNLGMTLYQLSQAEGTPDPSLRQEVLDCVNRVNAYATGREMAGRCNGTSYTTAYGRAAAHAMEVDQRNVDNYVTGRPIWHDYGDNHYSDDPATPLNPFTPFVHGAGREYVAGVQRSHWFYYTFPDNAEPQGLVNQIAVPGSWTIESWSRNAILSYWQYARDHMWDATPGQESWWDSQSQQYKPCFSLGTPVPIADWKAPVIGNKVHTLNPDGSALVTVSGVYDPDWPYLNWRFRGIGVDHVRVYYSVDGGATWQVLTASETAPGSTNYVATIPPQPGKTVLYYAEAEDGFGNRSTFPAGAPALHQLYSLAPVTYNMAWSAGALDSNGDSLPPAQGETSVTITTPGPTAVTLSSFTARSQSGGVLLQWQTSSEVDTYGFNLYRSATPNRADATLITPTFIPSRGRGATSGARYSFIDTSSPGSSFYWLEEVDLTERSTWYGPASSTLQSTTNTVYLPLIIH